MSTREQASSLESIWLENAKTHAFKLLCTFGSVREAVAYINRYEKVVKHGGGGTKQLIHDACLFSLPEILDTSEIFNSWNMSVWQTTVIAAKPNGPYDEIMRLCLSQKK